MCVLLRQMPLYINIPGRMAVYWLSNIGVGPSPNMSRRDLQLTVVSGWCWSTHPELDKRNMLSRHGEKSFDCRHG